MVSRKTNEQGKPVFDLSGGALCLDFANTVPDRPRKTSERLRGYEDLLNWGRQAGILTPAQVKRLSGRAAQTPEEADLALGRAVKFRESLYRIFTAFAGGGRPSARDLALLNETLAEALSHLRLCAGEEACRWKWSGLEEAFHGMLWPVARSAGNVLTSHDLERVRECASDTCSWLFLDQSRNQRRRWCDMKTCGNRHKARRFYRRKKTRQSAKTPDNA